MVGKVFGRLTVIEHTERAGYVLCKCECGNEKEVWIGNLKRAQNPTKSCGCLQKEWASQLGKKYIHENGKDCVAANIKFRTNFSVIENQTAYKNNTSGCKGVCFNKQKQKYQAYLNVHKKKIYLGAYASFDEAVAARKEGERKYYLPLISEKENGKLGC